MDYMNKTKIINAMELSAAAYKNIQPMAPGVTLGVIDSENGVQCFLRRQGDTLYITFRGSDSSRDWATDLTFWKKTLPYGNKFSPIRVHTGFINAYNSPSVRSVIHSWITGSTHHIKITGHSYGAALGVLCAVDIEYNFPDKDIEAIVFGCPRVGNNAFKKSYNKRVFKTVRVENGNDIVTKIPFAICGYRHVGTRLHIGLPRLLTNASRQDHRLQYYYESLIKKYLPD